MRSILLRLASSLLASVLLLGCGRFPARWPPEPDWGNPRIAQALALLKPADVRSATVDLDRCPRQPVALTPQSVEALLAQVSHLTSARTIGERSQWLRWRLLTLDCGEKGHFSMFIGTRPSLNGVAVLSVEQGIDSTVGGFYDGTAFWSWLQTVPESVALSAPPPPEVPCQ